MPCQQLGNAHIHKMSFNLFGGGNAEYASSGGTGLQFICFPEPRFTAVRPVAGPSWQGSALHLTTTLSTCTWPESELYKCNLCPVTMHF